MRGNRRPSRNVLYLNSKALCKLSSPRSELDLQLVSRQAEDMKIRPTLRIAFAGVFLLFLNACATNAPTALGLLVGVWTNSLGTIWTLKADGTFDVDRNHDGKRDIWGTYTVAADTITIQETGRTGPIPRECKGAGVYKFSRPNENTLTFTLVSDACGLRKKNVLLAQHRK